MAIRKNTRRFDPRYFMDEKTDIIKENIQMDINPDEKDFGPDFPNKEVLPRHGSPNSLKALQQLVGDKYVVVDVGNDDLPPDQPGYRMFAAMANRNPPAPPPEGKEDIIFIEKQYAPHSDPDKRIVYFKTVQGHKYGKAVVPK